MEKNEVIKFLKVLALFVAGLMGIAASAGCISYGASTPEKFYVFCGIINFAIVGFSVYSLYKLIFKKENDSEEKSTKQ